MRISSVFTPTALALSLISCGPAQDSPAAPDQEKIQSEFNLSARCVTLGTEMVALSNSLTPGPGSAALKDIAVRITAASLTSLTAQAKALNLSESDLDLVLLKEQAQLYTPDYSGSLLAKYLKDECLSFVPEEDKSAATALLDVIIEPEPLNQEDKPLPQLRGPLGPEPLPEYIPPPEPSRPLLPGPLRIA